MKPVLRGFASREPSADGVQGAAIPQAGRADGRRAGLGVEPAELVRIVEQGPAVVIGEAL